MTLQDTPIFLRDTFIAFFTNPFELNFVQVVIVVVIMTLVVTFTMSLINSYLGDSRNE